MKKKLLLTILILGFTLTQAQKSKTDSLIRVLQTQKQDTTRIHSLLLLAYLYRAVPDSSLRLSMEALELSTSLNYKLGINYSLSSMAIAYMFTGNYPQALNCTFKKLKIDVAEHDTVAIAGAYNLLGLLYREQGNYSEALNYLSKGLSIAQRGDLFLNISETYSNMHVLDSASLYARKGLNTATKSTSADFMQWAYGRMAAAYQDEGEYKLAKTYYDSCLSVNLRNDLSPWLAYLGLASMYEKTGQLDSSLYYARLCLAEVSQTGLYNARKKVIPIFTSVFEKMRNADSALFYMKLEKAVNDSMFSQQKLSQLQSLDFNEKIQEKEKEEAVQKAKESLRNQVIIFSLLGALVVFGAIAFILYRNNKQKQKANRRLQQQKEEIDNKNKELEIESALERVRSRSMGMQKSEELSEVIQLVLDQLCWLHFPIDAASFTVEFNESNDFRIWLAAPGQQYAARIDVPYLDHPIFNIVVEVKEKGETFYTQLLAKEEKNRFYDHFFKYAPVTEERKKMLYDSAGWALSAVLTKTVALTIYNYSAIPYSNEQNQALVRFGKAFEQTYTRFLDLQKVEAQAREAQIEAALERVRSRSLAMQKSEELREVIQLILDQLCTLHFTIDSASFTVEFNESNGFRYWIAAPGQQYASLVNLPYLNNPVFNKWLEANRKRENFLSYTMSKEEKDHFFDHFINSVPGVPEERKHFWYNGAGWANSSVLMKSLSLNIQNYSGIPYSEEENKTLVRFGKAFEQTYTRFLDLQKAEVNAREAVKQASIDRVRAEIASMRTTSDLEKITPLIWNELKNLQVPFIRCGVFIMDKEKEQIQVYLSTPDGKSIASFNLPYYSKGISEKMLVNWQKNEHFIDHWNPDTFSQWTKSLVEEGAIQADEKYNAEKPPENLYLHFLPFVQGMLYVGNVTPLTEDEIQSIQSLANSFATAYARYEDFNKLENAKQQVDIALKELRSAQQQLIQSEKMASLGELTAGIAHEIQNPLNFVNNFSEINRELIEELIGEKSKVNGERDKKFEEELISNIAENEAKIILHGKRAEAIVKGMLQHSRVSTGKKEPTDINALADEYLRLAYHGVRAKEKDFNAVLKTDFDESIGKIEVVPQDFGRVLLNLYNNAFYAVNEKKRQLNGTFEPTVSVTTKRTAGRVEISVKDNGSGVPQKVVDKIFQPFFTTKPTGHGTGLGLSLSYDIIKAHGGELKVETKEGEGSIFTVVILQQNLNK